MIPRLLQCRGRKLVVDGTTSVIGILNVTPDSFSDGGKWTSPGLAVERAAQMVREGAAAVDVGGQSTRPGHAEIAAGEEIGRILPVLEALVAAALPAPLSIDTYKPAVARAALRAGAHVLNDIHGFQGDPAMPAVAAEFGCPVILMHLERGFSDDPGDTIGRIKRYFERSLSIASAAGVPADRVILDPGIGFFKTAEQSMEIMARLDELKSCGCPILLGASRKSVIAHVVGGEASDRLEGTLATSVWAVIQGAQFVRVHDVRANVRAIRMAEALRARRDQTFSQARSATGSRPSSKSM